MKTLLILPPTVVHCTENESRPYWPPLGLAYLAAFVRGKGYNVEILDCALYGEVRKYQNETKYTGLSPNEVARKIEEFRPEVIGISVIAYNTVGITKAILRLAKRINPKILTIIGGAHASSDAETLIKDTLIDLIVIGEGEQTFFESLDRFKNGMNLYDVPGTAVRNNGTVMVNPFRAPIKDLDSLPFPARDSLDLAAYRNIEKSLANETFNMRSPVLTMISSRGCPYKCCFCSSPSTFGRDIRYRSPKSVVDEIEFLVEKYGAREIHFIDDNINVNKKRMISICCEIIDRKIDIKWTAPNGVSVASLDEEVLSYMKASGCYRISLGLESGDIEVSKWVGKKYSHDKVKSLIKYANQLGIWTNGCFMVGFPYETRKQMDMTLNFALGAKLDFAVFNIAVPYPGTEMRKHFEKEGLLKGKKDCYLSPSVESCDTKFFSAKEVKRFADDAFGKFFLIRLLRFWDIYKKVKSIEDLMYTVRLCKKYLIILYNRFKFGNFSYINIRKKKQFGFKT